MNMRNQPEAQIAAPKSQWYAVGPRNSDEMPMVIDKPYMYIRANSKAEAIQKALVEMGHHQECWGSQTSNSLSVGDPDVQFVE